MPEPLIIRVANHTRITINEDASISVEKDDHTITLPPDEARRIVVAWVHWFGTGTPLILEGMDDILEELEISKPK